MSANAYLNFVVESFKIQDELNKQINPNWIAERSLTDYLRAIWVELAEAMDSTAWKWWKHQKEDTNNLKIEVIDVYHFLISYMILLKDKYGINVDIVSDFANKLDLEFNKTSRTYKTKDIQFLIEFLVADAIFRNYQDLYNKFAELASKVFKSFDEFKLLYKGKLLLNKIRNKYGYTDGTYNKVVDGKEDNEILMQLVNECKSEKELENKLLQALGISKQEEEKNNIQEQKDIKLTNKKKQKIEVEEL